jgi:predicted nucleic acid-binding Zn ribbon protein
MTSWLDRERQRMEGEKRCSQCSRWLPLEAFPAHRAATKDWRDRNRERINEERRAEYREAHPRVERQCVVCGAAFVRKPDAIVCSAECRRVRQREQRRERQRRAPTSAST